MIEDCKVRKGKECRGRASIAVKLALYSLFFFSCHLGDLPKNHDISVHQFKALKGWVDDG